LNWNDSKLSIYVHINLKKQFQYFIFEKCDFFVCLDCPPGEKSNILAHNY